MSIILVYEIHSEDEIAEKYLKKFILTNLELKNVNFDKNSKIIYSYIKELKHYQVLFIKNEFPDFLKYISKEKEEIILDEKQIIVYKNSKFFYMQKTTSIDNSLISILKKTLNLNEAVITQKKEKVINKKTNIKYIKPIETHSFKLFSLYVFSLLTALSFYDFSLSTDLNSIYKIKTKTLKIKKQMQFYSLTNEVANIFKKAKSNSSVITSITFKNSKLLIEIQSKNKKNIYNFFNLSEDKTIENIVYNKEIKRYVANANYKIYRK